MRPPIFAPGQPDSYRARIRDALGRSNGNTRWRCGIAQILFTEEGRAQVETHRYRLADRLEFRRDALGFADIWDKRPIPDRERYEAWRDGTDEAVAAAESVLADRRKHGIHLDGLAYRDQSLASALSRVRQVLRQHDRHIAASLAGTRGGEVALDRLPPASALSSGETVRAEEAPLEQPGT